MFKKWKSRNGGQAMQEWLICKSRAFCERFFRSYGALDPQGCFIPTACAVGCILSPLCGLYRAAASIHHAKRSRAIHISDAVAVRIGFYGSMPTATVLVRMWVM
jgi:hypothetical protein